MNETTDKVSVKSDTCKSVCRKCGGELKLGTALQNKPSFGVADFPNSKDTRGQTYTYSGEAGLIDVLKCGECGYSRSK